MGASRKAQEKGKSIRTDLKTQCRDNLSLCPLLFKGEYEKEAQEKPG